MSVLLGSLLGFGSSVLPAVADHFNAKENNKTKLAQMQIQKEILTTKGDISLKAYTEQATDSEHARLLNHSEALGKEIGIMGALRKSVRPVITYAFFGLFVAVKFYQVNAALDVDGDILAALDSVWDTESKTIFASIISYWFGSRAIEKSLQNRTSGIPSV